MRVSSTGPQVPLLDQATLTPLCLHSWESGTEGPSVTVVEGMLGLASVPITSPLSPVPLEP